MIELMHLFFKNIICASFTRWCVLCYGVSPSGKDHSVQERLHQGQSAKKRRTVPDGYVLIQCIEK